MEPSKSPGCGKPFTSQDKWGISIISGLLFLLISSPFLYIQTNDLIDSISAIGPIADKNGSPNIKGIILHSVLFSAIIRLMMDSPNKEGCVKPYTSKDKWIVSSIAGLMFLLISSPFLYKTINEVISVSGFSISDDYGRPNIAGLLLHTTIYVLTTRLLMR